MQVTGRHIDTGNPVQLEFHGENIAAFTPLDLSADQVASLPWLAPGLFDLQVNGAHDIWFSDEQLTVEQVVQVLESLLPHGMTRVFPTLITNSQAALKHGFEVIRAACEEFPWVNHMVSGCHLEGPNISREDGPRGAHPLQHVRPCSISEFEELQEASGGRIRLVTLAPETEGSVPFIQHLTASGVVCAIGHTAANSAQIAAAVDAGAQMTTHFGNGAHGTLPRHPNYLWDQLAEPRLAASIIPDGHHIPASVARSVLLAKGPENVIITCDSSGLAGCPPGEYAAAGGRCEVLDGGRIVVAGQRQYLAGSGAFTEECVAGMMQLTAIPLPYAWAMAHRIPSSLMGLPDRELQVDHPADVVLFDLSEDASLKIREVYLQGQRRYPK